MPLVPKYPLVRLISPLRRRIAYVSPGSRASEQLHRLGWSLYTGPATIHTHYAGLGRTDSPFNPALDPRNGFIVPGSDPDITPTDRPAGSIDFNPHVGEIV